MTTQDFLIKWGVYGLAVGVLCDAMYFGTDGAMTVGVCVVGMAAGALAQYLLRQNLLGCLLCSLLALAAMDGVRILARLFWGDWELGAMLSLAGREILLSLIFVFPVYALFLWVYRRVPRKTVL
ncbi:rod shape-determining protein MreD [Flavonifractor sp. An306]|uniref:rod shape-determining protein MreD n=1 Tax=Flavonifractor sp. An306 TaxID=1965629 RepID=UPI001FA916E1|nr:rod shape-determining protein MreD [Flavonifractor sp. An306]